MDDKQIIELYWERSQEAIVQTENKYGAYCFRIAYNILANKEDSEECVNDSWLKVWNAIPPRRPSLFKAFVGTVTRNTSLDRYFKYSAKKRGNGQIPLVLDELHNISGEDDNPETIVDAIVLAEVLNTFLASLKKEARIIFMRRYWYMDSIADIASAMKISESKVKMSLSRSRSGLKELLKKEGVLF